MRDTFTSRRSGRAAPIRSGYSVRKGYNLVTGLGTVNGRYLVPELAHSA
jgi:hypothetical protein